MIYLNNAATSFPKPKVVHDAVRNYMETVPFDHARGSVGCTEDIPAICRDRLATLFHIAHPEQIIFTSGATEALNLALFGLDRGAHIVTTTTEHNSVLRPLKVLEAEGHITLSFVSCDHNGYLHPSAIASAMCENTRAVIVNHCSNVTGRVTDVKEIAGIAHARDALIIVDASQSAGIVPLDVQDADIDLLAFTGHKSLYGTTGIGGLYMKEPFMLRPLKVGGTGVRSDLMVQPREMPIYYEAGTQNISGITALSAGVSFILDTGITAIRERKQQFIGRIHDALASMPGITLYGGEHPAELSVLSFNIKGFSPADVGFILEQSFHIIVRSGLHCAPLIHRDLGSFPEGTVRISPSFFTTPEEIEVLIDAIRQIAATGKTS